MSDVDQLLELYRRVRQEVTEGSRLVDWAEDEIGMAMKRHPAEAGAASSFYLRMWAQAFPDHPVWPEGAGHHEALYGSQIDDLERDVRRKLAIPNRRLEFLAIECDGDHWGKPVQCRYASLAERQAS